MFVLTDFGEIVSMEKQPFWQLFQFQIGSIAKKPIYSVELSQTGSNSKKAPTTVGRKKKNSIPGQAPQRHHVNVNHQWQGSRIQVPKQSAPRFYKQSYLTMKANKKRRRKIINPSSNQLMWKIISTTPLA
jgi:hypothetical protein